MQINQSSFVVSQTFGGPLHRFDNLLIAGTPAEISAQAFAYFELRGRRILIEEFENGHQKPRCAEAALKSGCLEKPLLDDVKRITGRPLRGESFHGDDFSTVRLDSKQQT